MATMTFSDHAPESITRVTWTSHDWYDLFVFVVQSCGIVCVSVFLYSLGPALGITVLAGSLVAWSKVTNHLASARAPHLADEDGEHDSPADSMRVPSGCADTARLQNNPLGASTATDSRPVIRQSA